jgi:homoserine O-succinyltransferase/O-acetyltransferase
MWRVPSPLVIGLVNNMPDAALRTGEAQFRDLLGAAAQGRPLDLRFYALPDVPRSGTARAYLAGRYRDIAALWEQPVDGLIVTGAEPGTGDVRDEPYWPTLARLVDWAEENTSSAIWSCLAAHAGVLRLDGIERRPLGEKLSGVFESAIAADHPLVAGVPRRCWVPHSRCHGVPEQPLRDQGYAILLRSEEAGPDIFLKERKSLFLFIQGHPEYDAQALQREYRRDIGRFLAGRNPDYPEMPSGYFAAAATSVFAAFRERAEEGRRGDLAERIPDAEIDETVPPRWRVPALRVYQNWLTLLAAQRRSARGFV